MRSSIPSFFLMQHVKSLIFIRWATEHTCNSAKSMNAVDGVNVLRQKRQPPRYMHKPIKCALRPPKPSQPRIWQNVLIACLQAYLINELKKKLPTFDSPPL